MKRFIIRLFESTSLSQSIPKKAPSPRKMAEEHGDHLQENGEDHGIFSENFRPTWYLLAIPGFSVAITIIVALSVVLSRRIRRRRARDARAKPNLPVEPGAWPSEESLPEIEMNYDYLEHFDEDFLAPRPSVSFLEARRSSAVIIE